MKKFTKNCLSIIASLGIVLSACSKKEEPKLFDLLPLKVGTTFFYKYSLTNYTDFSNRVGNFSSGEIKWTIISKSSNDTSTVYLFEEKFNGFAYRHKVISCCPFTFMSDTTIIKDSINYFKVFENPSGNISFWDIYFKRYNASNELEIHNFPSHNFGKHYYFRTDTGLKLYHQENYFGMSHQFFESYTLDSLSLIH
jgi:hypothetical protein